LRDRLFCTIIRAVAHGGNIRELARKAGKKPEEILDFSASINPLGPPDWLRSVVARALDWVEHYPDPEATELVAAAVAHYGVPAAEVAVGNGSTELLHAACALAARLGLTRAVIPVPAYTDYALAAEAAGLEVEELRPALRTGAGGFDPDPERLGGNGRPELVILCSPNNPTGAVIPAREVRTLAARRPDSLFIVDEAFADFVPDLDRLTAERPANVVCLLSLTKFHALPGLRLGLALAAPDLAAGLRERVLPWSVNTLAQAAGVRALADQDHARRTIEAVSSWRAELAKGLAAIPGIQVFPSAANFLLCRLGMRAVSAGEEENTGYSTGTTPAFNEKKKKNFQPSNAMGDAQCAPSPGSAAGLAERLLLAHGIAIRDCAGFAGLDGTYFRLAVRRPEENARLLEALEQVFRADQNDKDSPAGSRSSDPGTPGSAAGAGLSGTQPNFLTAPGLPRRRQTPAVMIQGTASNAGKSVLCAALCRILLDDGFNPAPFKAQNMSLNSCVTPDGLEMGRAQVTQAAACRLAPDARMNPVLLKPCSDTGSQVVVLGRPRGNMRVAEYTAAKAGLFAEVKASYDALAAEHGVMVLEGAGSPAEINLAAHDIVNMRMAEHAKAAVLLAGDIDRGGVFAAFAGTLELLPDRHRRLVKGLVINKFRGDQSLLAPGLAEIAARTGKPFLGVVPWLQHLGLPEEDSVSFAAGTAEALRPKDEAPGSMVDVAWIGLPHIANFTDLDALAAEPDVAVRVVRRPEDLGRPQAVVLPGSKNVPGDLAWLASSGLAAAITDLASRGVEVVGVCGGYQMLGQEVSDPHGIESAGTTVRGLGLLPLFTELAMDKTLARVEATHLASGQALSGYEIHHGLTRPAGAGALPAVLRGDGSVIGHGRADGLAWGTYLHGLFDADVFRRWWVDGLRVRSGLPPAGRVLARLDIEPALDRLALAVRRSLDIPALYALLGLR